MRSRRHARFSPAPRSAFTGYRFPPEVITLAVRWYLRFGLSYRDVEELLAERGVEVDHVTVYRWVHRFAPEFAEAARACRHIVGDRWHVDETYLKVGGTWRYLFRAIDQFGQVIDVFLSPRRDAKAARQFFERAIGRARISPIEVTTDRYRVYPRLVDELFPAAFHCTEVHANNLLEADHGRLKARLRPIRLFEARPHRQRHRRRPRVHPEHPQGLVRPRDRRGACFSRCRCVRRTGGGDLIPSRSGGSATN